MKIEIHSLQTQLFWLLGNDQNFRPNLNIQHCFVIVTERRKLEGETRKKRGGAAATDDEATKNLELVPRFQRHF